MNNPRPATHPTADVSSMDVARDRRRLIPRAAYVTAAVVTLIVLAAWAFAALVHRTGGIVVDRATILTDVAKRGTLLISVSAQGVLAPQRLRVVSATQPGVVDAIAVRPGSIVSRGALIARMDNPTLTADVETAQSAVRVAKANLDDASQQAQAEIITQQSTLSDAQAELQATGLQAQSYTVLHRQGLIADLTYRQAKIQAEKSAAEARNAQAHLRVARADGQAKIAAAQAQVAQASALLQAADAQVAALTVRSASSGVVQSVDVDPGVSVAQNTQIARIANMRDLKAVLQVAEGDAHAIADGMSARVDTGSGVAEGRVARIAPAAQNGTVAVDVTFAHPLPAGSRPDANVSGTITVARIAAAVSIARPAGAVDGSTIDLFKVVDDGTRAVRVRVELGRGSVDRVQVLSGLAPGDSVIVSDMSAYQNRTDIRLR